jgi:hypothetical protein
VEKHLFELYSGFVIADPVGNNVFSFDRRRHRSIWVPPLKRGLPADLRRGQEPVFSEVRDGREVNVTGLENFIYYTPQDNKPVFFFDNHNHAFCFWAAALRSGYFPRGATLVHVDQHKDTREPPRPFMPPGAGPVLFSLDEAFGYANYVLNVGNFIRPALDAGFFSEVVIIDREDALRREPRTPFVLDIDLDIFAPEMAYIPYDRKLAVIRGLVRSAAVITVATSPYFMDQVEALRVAREIFAPEGFDLPAAL